jgi:hypothetical protein
MYVQHPVFVDPIETSIPLWRYIDFTKFASLIERKELFFCRADKLQVYDRFEGTYPLKEVDYLYKNHNIDTRKLTSLGSTTTFVNCWHLNNKESVGMWKVYAPLGYGIAIRTTILDMRESFLDASESIYAGMVQYVDYATDTFYAHESRGGRSGNLFVPFIHKRSIFDYEKEYRIIYALHESPPEHGVFIPVNIERLIHAVIVAPNSPDWFIELVNTFLRKSISGLSVQKSTFDIEPYYREHLPAA